MNISTSKGCIRAFVITLLTYFSIHSNTLLAQSKNCDTETAFAFLNNDDDPLTADAASNCFIPEFNRWGWTTYLDFTEDSGQSNYTLDIYSGAGQCDLSKGTDVGSVNISYNADSSVTFNYSLESYALSEAHIYIGTNPYPTNNSGQETVAPGKYTFTDSDFEPVSDYTVTIPVEGNAFYIIVHGVTQAADCDDPSDDDDDCPDSDNDGVCDEDDICPGFDDSIDTDGDGIPDGCDTGECPDTDKDGICDEDDICPGFDDTIDTDGDGIPDGCDTEECPDTDKDGICDEDDICPGFDDAIDTDGDGIPDGCDEDECPDSDGDGVCDEDDICPGFDDTIDNNGNGIPDGCDGVFAPAYVKVYSRPYDRTINIQYQFDYDTTISFEVFDAKGIKITEWTDPNYIKNKKRSYNLNTVQYSSQLLILRITTTQTQITKKIISSN